MSFTQADSATVTTAILAGGAASRMGGKDKGLYPLQNRHLVEWVVEALRRESIGPLLIVANRNVSSYAQIARTIMDKAPGHAGPLAGVCAALTVCDTPWLLTVPVDCAKPPTGLLRDLLTAAHQRKARAVVAHDGHRRQPLFALYSTEFADSCATGLAQIQGVSRWQDSIGIVEIGFAHPLSDWINLNSEAEFAAFEAALDEQ